ncbi:MAG TPA: hypothetical protein PKO17_04600 [Pseudomonadales bacterium]|nr:hypothetical protein [Pseudomonadales bacterium]
MIEKKDRLDQLRKTVALNAVPLHFSCQEEASFLGEILVGAKRRTYNCACRRTNKRQSHANRSAHRRCSDSVFHNL